MKIMTATSQLRRHIINKNSQGFSLIELLVVISIISYLASVVFVKFDNTRAEARDSRRYNDLHQVQIALETYYNINRSYPDTGGKWWTYCSHDQDPTPRATTGADGYIPNLAPDYISELPIDPQGCEDRSLNYGEGHFGSYIYRSNGTDYKFAGDWTVENGTACKPGNRYWDPQRGEGGAGNVPVRDGIVFCSVYTEGAALW